MSKQNNNICFHKSFLFVSTILIFLISLVLLSNTINSRRLAQNSRASFGTINLDSYRTASPPSQLRPDFQISFVGNMQIGESKPLGNVQIGGSAPHWNLETIISNKGTASKPATINNC